MTGPSTCLESRTATAPGTLRAISTHSPPPLLWLDFWKQKLFTHSALNSATGENALKRVPRGGGKDDDGAGCLLRVADGDRARDVAGHLDALAFWGAVAGLGELEHCHSFTSLAMLCMNRAESWGDKLTLTR